MEAARSPMAAHIAGGLPAARPRPSSAAAAMPWRMPKSLCAARAERLTPIRRQVLEALLSTHRPLGAYELIDRLAEWGGRPAPITVYRALDFLLGAGPGA